jgi:hypothetical protein
MIINVLRRFLQVRQSTADIVQEWHGTGEALPHFWCKRSSARAAMPLRKNGVLGWLVTCCRFVVGAAHDIEKGEAPERLALIALA